MWAEFKEKTFEAAFVGELRLLTNAIYAPDQCDENYLGFDASAFVPWELLPPILPHIRFRRWRHLIGISAHEIDDFGRRLNKLLPPFRLNLFIQFKRPEYLKRKNATEWDFWKRPYFRYAIRKHQQNLLERISEVGSRRVAVVYAVPAFHKSVDLFNHMTNDSVIKNTNVLSAPFLRGHSKCTFVQAGNVGFGHSEPVEIQSPSLQEFIAEAKYGERLLFTRHMKDAAEIIKRLFEDDEESRNTLALARKAIWGGDLSETYPEAADSWLDANLTVVAFSSAFGIRVCALS